ncbi:unnamed protein product, partial [Cylicocyclus nassatus]
RHHLERCSHHPTVDHCCSSIRFTLYTAINLIPYYSFVFLINNHSLLCAVTASEGPTLTGSSEWSSKSDKRHDRDRSKIVLILQYLPAVDNGKTPTDRTSGFCYNCKGIGHMKQCPSAERRNTGHHRDNDDMVDFPYCLTGTPEEGTFSTSTPIAIQPHNIASKQITDIFVLTFFSLET